MKRTTWLLMLVIMALAAGCAVTAEDHLSKLDVGMTQAEVEKALGKPEKAQCVRFPAHDRDYLVWEYQMVPDSGPVCPSEGAARMVTGVVTLGLSEVAWSHAKTKAHWVYFLDGYMVFAGRGFDCSSPEICSINQDNLAGAVCRK
ncbi:hypothetical protein AAU61_13710 [Desulfocarbo indianensis]|nr:hypothetical protein AAU61_13710 [Desulfocarbo indianensis]